MIQVVAGFDEPAWRRLAVRSPLQSAAWLSVMASRLPGACYTVTAGDRLGFLATVVTDPDAYEAYNPYAILWRDPPVFPLAKPQRRRAELHRFGEPGLLPALVLVAPGYLGDPAGSGGADPELVRAVLADLVAWCGSRRIASLFVLYTQWSTAAVEAAFGTVGGVSFPLTTRWSLPVRWQSWDGYLASFSRQRARKILREMRSAAQCGLRPGPVSLDRYADRVVAGRCALLRHYGQQADEAAERARLRGLAAAFGPSLLVYGALKDGADPVASVVCLRHDRVVRVVYAATVDEARLHYPGAHFMAAFYAPAQALTSRDTDEIDYGIGHGPSKSARGCRAQLTYGHAVAVDGRARDALALGAGLLAECGQPATGEPAGGGLAAGHPRSDHAHRGDEGGQ